MATAEEADQAVKRFNAHNLDGRPLKVSNSSGPGMGGRARRFMVGFATRCGVAPNDARRVLHHRSVRGAADAPDHTSGSPVGYRVAQGHR
jgi:hypothetical protein